MTISAAPHRPVDSALLVLPVQERFRIRGDAETVVLDSGAMELRHSRFRLRLGVLPLGQRAMIMRLSQGWESDVELNAVVTGLDGENRVLSAQLLLRRLLAHSWLARRLQVQERPLVDVLPRGLGQNSQPTPRRHEPGVPYVLSRFASVQARNGALVISSPIGRTVILCHDPQLVASLVVCAGAGYSTTDLALRMRIDLDVAGHLVDELLTAGTFVSAAEQALQEHEPAAFWSAEDLAVHLRSRPGRHVEAIGGTYRYENVVEPAPLARTFPHTQAINLTAPGAPAHDPTLSELVERRSSIRDHDALQPISLDQLSEFLYRVQHLTPIGQSHGQQLGGRPYPVGGGICELEIYPVVGQCAGLESGVYHYDSSGHRLELLNGPVPALDRMLDYARAAAAATDRPQVLLVIASRVQRLMWKYEGIGYVMTLKHSGVLTELMYLVATAMGLAPCALGAGDSEAFALATGLDPLVEPSIAEFMLGTPATEMGTK